MGEDDTSAVSHTDQLLDLLTDTIRWEQARRAAIEQKERDRGIHQEENREWLSSFGREELCRSFLAAAKGTEDPDTEAPDGSSWFLDE